MSISETIPQVITRLTSRVRELEAMLLDQCAITGRIECERADAREACALRFREGYTDGQMSAEPQRMRDIAAAVAAEREACAVTAEEYPDSGYLCESIAAAIRARGGT